MHAIKIDTDQNEWAGAFRYRAYDYNYYGRFSEQFRKIHRPQIHAHEPEGKFNFFSSTALPLAIPPRIVPSTRRQNLLRRPRLG